MLVFKPGDGPTVGAPGTWEADGERDFKTYADEMGIPVKALLKHAQSRYENAWHIKLASKSKAKQRGGQKGWGYGAPHMDTVPEKGVILMCKPSDAYQEKMLLKLALVSYPQVMVCMSACLHALAAHACTWVCVRVRMRVRMRVCVQFMDAFAFICSRSLYRHARCRNVCVCP